jgi:hypothetical protein
LEIIDRYGYVVFSMWIDQNSTLQMRGYYVGKLATYFMNTIVLDYVLKTDLQYIQKCSDLASRLKPKFRKLN